MAALRKTKEEIGEDEMSDRCEKCKKEKAINNGLCINCGGMTKPSKPRKPLIIKCLVCKKIGGIWCSEHRPVKINIKGIHYA